MFAEDVPAIHNDIVDAAVATFDRDVGSEVLLKFVRQPVGARLVVSGLAILDQDIHRGLRSRGVVSLSARPQSTAPNTLRSSDVMAALSPAVRGRIWWT